MRYPNQLQITRQRLLISQQDLADKMRLNRRQVSRWEAGEVQPSLRNKRRVLQALGVPLEDVDQVFPILPNGRTPRSTLLCNVPDCTRYRHPDRMRCRLHLMLHGARAAVASMLLLLLAPLAHADNTREVLLRWAPPENAAESGPLRYVLFRSPNGGPEERIEVGEGTEFSLGFLGDRTYQLELIAIGEGGESPRSNRLSLEKLPDPPLPPRRFEIVVPAVGAPTIRELP